ncbi:MAG: hypothetical protein AAGA80_28880 [Cyanobacteria bacterium P01_F01_bin.143]
MLGLRGFTAVRLEISSHILPPPSLGEHNDVILAQKLGYNTAEIEELGKRGVI